MALDQLPDFRFQGQAPQAAIINAYMERARQEQQQATQAQQMERQKFNDIIQAFQMGSQAISSFVQASKRQQEKETAENLSSKLLEGNELIPTGPGGTAKVMGQNIPIASMQPKSESEQYKNELKMLLAKANPQITQQHLAQQLFPQPKDQRGQVTGRDIQQFYLVSPDGEKRIPVRYDEVADELSNVVTGEPIDRQKYRGYQMERSLPNVLKNELGGYDLVSRGTGQSSPLNTSARKQMEGEGEDFKGGLDDLQVTAPRVFERFEEHYKKAFPENNKFLETMVQGASSAAQVKSILEAEGDDMSQVGLQSLGFYFARMAGSNSQLSDREREVFEQPLALIDTVVNKAYRIGKGDLSPKMKKDLMNLANTLEKKSKIQAKKVLAEAKERSKAITGRYWNESIEESFPTLDDLIVTTEDMQPQQKKKRPLDSFFREGE